MSNNPTVTGRVTVNGKQYGMTKSESGDHVLQVIGSLAHRAMNELGMLNAQGIVRQQVQDGDGEWYTVGTTYSALALVDE